nr:hypothetical protein [Tanacetum cinerariifolium]
AFQVTTDVPEIYMQEFWATAKLHHNSIRFKIDTKKSVLDLEAIREMLHINPRIPSQSFAELPSEEEILEFLSDQQVPDWQKLWHRQFQIITSTNSMGILSLNKRKPSISRRNRINWHYIRDDVLFSTIKVVSRNQTTQQYGAILPIELTTDDIRNSKAYKQYYACATREAAPKPKASAKKKKGDSAFSTTPPTPTPTTTVVSALRLSKGKQPARTITPIEPIDVERTKAEQLKIALKRSRQETHISQQCGSGTDEGTSSRPGVPDVPSDDSEEELSWNSSDDEEGDEQTKGSEDESNDEEDQELRLSEEVRIQEEEEADELYHDVNINQGRGLQVTQNIKDSHVTLTSVHPDGPQESSSVSSFMTSMLNPISDAGVESIFTTTSSPIVSLQTPTPIMTPSIIATITTSSDAPIPPTTIPSIILENLPTFNSAFRFDERLRSLENTFFEYRQTNPFIDVVSAIPESVNATVEAEVLTRSSHSSRTSYAIAADLSEMELKKILIEKMEGNKKDPPLDQTGGIKDKKEGGEHASASTPSETATGSAGRSTTRSQSRQLSTSESAFAEEHVQTTYQMEEPLHPVFKTGANDQPIVQTSQHPKWFSQPRRPPSPDRDWNKTLPAAQGDAQSWISDIARKTNARSSFNKLLDTPIDFSNFIMNRLNVDTLTLELLAGPTYELMRGSCNSLTELEYHLEEQI